jgi:mono/diheme cytochrome c family protein
VTRVALAFLLACSPGGAPPTVAPAPKPAEPAPAPPPRPDPVADTEAVEVQIELGKQLYADACATCHGDAGEGTEDGPPLVGEGVLPAEPRPGAKREVRFRTAADVYAFARTTMPADDPGALAADQYLAICAFALRANGIALARPLDPVTAQLLVLHP